MNLSTIASWYLGSPDQLGKIIRPLGEEFAVKPEKRLGGYICELPLALQKGSVTEIEKGGETGVGSIRRTVWRSALPYRIEFDSEVVRIEKHKLIEARAFGELDGLGLWQFESVTSDRTRIQYDWHVKTTKAWMNLLAPVARPFFRWNHDTIMRWGEEGLKSRLGV